MTKTIPSHNHAANIAHDLASTRALIQLHNTLEGLPTKLTWHQEVNSNRFSAWSGLTPEVVAKKIPDADEKILGTKSQCIKILNQLKLKKKYQNNND